MSISDAITFMIIISTGPYTKPTSMGQRHESRKEKGKHTFLLPVVLNILETSIPELELCFSSPFVMVTTYFLMGSHLCAWASEGTQLILSASQCVHTPNSIVHISYFWSIVTWCLEDWPMTRAGPRTVRFRSFLSTLGKSCSICVTDFFR